MKCRVYKTFADKLDDDVWLGHSIRSELTRMATDDSEFLEYIVECALDDEFDVFYSYPNETETVVVDLPNEIEALQSRIMKEKGCTPVQAATCILDVVELFLINGKRMNS